jgi:ferredoxin
MTKRKIIKIDEEKCTGCGKCIPNCPEGALQIIDGKARLVSDLFCDGLGACIGSCPYGAITIEKREAENYDERKVMENIVKQGKNTIIAHLRHLRDHNQHEYLKEAIQFLKEKGIEIGEDIEKEGTSKERAFSGCPGARVIEFGEEKRQMNSSLRQWPIQLHLISPSASYFHSKDVIICADCVAYALGDFHTKYLEGKCLAIGCPKLDTNQEVYVEKIKALIDEAKINTLTVMIMEVPCCRGLLSVVQKALEKAERKVPLKCIVVGVRGDVLSDEWITFGER